MATHKSAKKRIRTNERKREINKTYTSKIKSSIKKVLESTSREEAEKLYKDAVSTLDKGTAKGVIKKNTASRNKSTITKHLNSLKPAETEAETKE
jgi:small subunit ribosomal protein S20